MEWIKQNSVALIFALTSIAVSWGITNERVNSVQAKVEEYPSADFFKLQNQNIQEKFDTIQNSLNDLNKKIEHHIEVTSQFAPPSQK